MAAVAAAAGRGRRTRQRPAAPTTAAPCRPRLRPVRAGRAPRPAHRVCTVPARHSAASACHRPPAIGGVRAGAGPLPGPSGAGRGNGMCLAAQMATQHRAERRCWSMTTRDNQPCAILPHSCPGARVHEDRDPAWRRQPAAAAPQPRQRRVHPRAGRDGHRQRQRPLGTGEHVARRGAPARQRPQPGWPPRPARARRARRGADRRPGRPRRRPAEPARRRADRPVRHAGGLRAP
jgi:hypothetical protein